MGIFIGVYIFLCVLAGIFGRKRAMGFWGGVLFSIMLTPLILLAILLITAPQAPPAAVRR
jgi:hypothetical protein